MKPILTAEGFAYRTRLMDPRRAAAFAACLRANDRFRQITIDEKTVSRKGERLVQNFVVFQPSSDDRRTQLLQDQYDQRVLRGRTEEFIFWPDANILNKWWCYSVGSGETYEVTLGDCTCADYHYRCCRAGILCKHMQAWSHQRGQGLLGKVSTDTASDPALAPAPFVPNQTTLTEREARRARLAHDFDF